MIDGRAVRVRLAAIDAGWESGQAFGERARRALADMVAGRDVELRQVGVDVHKRPLVVLCRSRISVNAELARLGWAWSIANAAATRRRSRSRSGHDAPLGFVGRSASGFRHY